MDLNDPARIGALLAHFSLPTKGPEVVIAGHQNRTPGTKTIVDQREDSEFRAVIEGLPGDRLEIFRHAPYRDWPWVSRLVGQ
jgi:hypothetical protein